MNRPLSTQSEALPVLPSDITLTGPREDTNPKDLWRWSAAWREPREGVCSQWHGHGATPALAVADLLFAYARALEQGTRP